MTQTKLTAARQIVEKLKSYYPTDIFGEDWTKEELSEVHEFLKTKGKTLDSLTGFYGRHYCDLILGEFDDYEKEQTDAD